MLKRLIEDNNKAPSWAKQPEEWKIIPDYPAYQISNRGRIRVIRYIKPYQDRVVLSKDGIKHIFSLEYLYKSAFKGK